MLCFGPVSRKLPHAEEVIDQLVGRLQALEGVALTAEGDIRHRGRIVGHLSRAERRLTVPLRRDISIAPGIADELAAEHPLLRREGGNLVIDLDGPDAADAGAKLLERRLRADQYAAQYVESSP